MDSSVLLTARLLVAAVFLVSGLAKLLDRSGSRQAVADFGLPAILTRPVAVLLAPLELGIALLLLPRATAWGAGIAALALLLLFSSAIAFNLARGRRPQCHCFGQLSAGPVGWRTLARNAAFATPAAYLVAAGRTDPGAGAAQWLTVLRPAEVVGLVLAVFGYCLLGALCVLAFNLMRQQGRLLERIDALEGALTNGASLPAWVDGEHASAQPVHGLPVGSRAPAFSLTGLYGETLTLDALRVQGRSVALVFLDPGCGPCSALLPEIGRWQRDQAALTVVAISRGPVEANRARSTEHGVSPLLLEEGEAVSRAYKVQGTPSAVIVLADGAIGSPVVPGADAIRALVRTTLHSLAPAAVQHPAYAPAPRASLPVLPLNAAAAREGASAPAAPPLAIGAAAPSLELPAVSGDTIRLVDLRGHPLLLLFWNLDCGFCRRMLPDLRAWEAAHLGALPRVLVVSSGTAEANRALGLHSPVALDHGVGVGAMFGAHGTPMAVLLDGAGRVASGVAAGAPAVFELLNGGAMR